MTVRNPDRDWCKWCRRSCPIPLGVRGRNAAAWQHALVNRRQDCLGRAVTSHHGERDNRLTPARPVVGVTLRRLRATGLSFDLTRRGYGSFETSRAGVTQPDTAFSHGTRTILFTDLEGPTDLRVRLGDILANEVFAKHDQRSALLVSG